MFSCLCQLIDLILHWRTVCRIDEDKLLQLLISNFFYSFTQDLKKTKKSSYISVGFMLCTHLLEYTVEKTRKKITVFDLQVIKTWHNHSNSIKKT